MTHTVLHTPTETEPRVWLGCLACYNNGDLVGRWVAAIDADNTTLDDIHDTTFPRHASCEERWCFDHDNIPVRGELDPYSATLWGERLAEVDDHLRPAFVAWVHTGCTIVDTDEIPVLADFLERYMGEWTSFREYAEQEVEDTGMLEGVPEALARYFDWDSWTRDLAHDYVTEPASGGGVYVFRCL